MPVARSGRHGKVCRVTLGDRPPAPNLRLAPRPGARRAGLPAPPALRGGRRLWGRHGGAPGLTMAPHWACFGSSAATVAGPGGGDRRRACTSVLGRRRAAGCRNSSPCCWASPPYGCGRLDGPRIDHGLRLSRRPHRGPTVDFVASGATDLSAVTPTPDHRVHAGRHARHRPGRLLGDWGSFRLRSALFGAVPAFAYFVVCCTVGAGPGWQWAVAVRWRRSGLPDGLRGVGRPGGPGVVRQPPMRHVSLGRTAGGVAGGAALFAAVAVTPLVGTAEGRGSFRVAGRPWQRRIRSSTGSRIRSWTCIPGW